MAEGGKKYFSSWLNRAAFSVVPPPVVPVFETPPAEMKFQKQLKAFVNTMWHLENTGKGTQAQVGSCLGEILFWPLAVLSELEQGAKSTLSTYCVA